MIECNAFIAWVRALTAVDLTTRSILIDSTAPDFVFGIAVAVPARTERAACSESS